MYKVYLDGVRIYDDFTPLEEYKLSEPKMVLEDNAAGSFEFMLPKINRGYGKVNLLTSTIEVRRDADDAFWRFRPITRDKDWWNNEKIFCEGELAFLNDSIQPQAEYHDRTPKQFVGDLLTAHNKYTDARKRFYPGIVTVTKGDEEGSTTLYRLTDYESTFECFQDKLIERLGGHLRIRYENGLRYLDYLSTYNAKVVQEINFGKNLLDYSSNFTLADICTVLIPLGKSLDEENYTSDHIEALSEYLTVKSVNGGSIYVTNDTPLKTFGRFERVEKWDDVELPENLLKRAREYLKSLQYDNVVLEINAFDWNLLDPGVKPLNLLDQIRAKSVPHGMDHVFPITKMEIPLDNPSGTTLTLGYETNPTLTKQFAKNSK